MRRVFVVGVGMTRVGRRFDKGLGELAAEAIFRAIDDARGARPEALVVGNMMASSLFNQDNLGALVADYAGLRGVAAYHVEAACGSGGHAVVAGYSLVASGLYDVVLVVGVEKMCDYPTSVVTAALAQAADAEHELVYGISFPSLNALVMRLYMKTFGASREALAQWPVRMHEYGSRNPYAQLRFRISVDDVVRSPVIADPIRLLDSSPIGDGAAALVLASEDVARKLSDTPVEVAGVGMATDSVDLSSRMDLLDAPSVRLAAEKAYRMARVSPRDIDVAEVHDAFTVTGLLCLEALGFVERGKAWKEFADGRFGPGDKPSVNLSGGLKARGHPVGATGVYQVAEIAMQLRGDFPGVKAGSPSIGLAANFGGVATQTSVVVLRR
ncbi:MAG: thiolase domain-containing protein [Crenarchaeota archaeon]|nr:thiolase domain-containing protein [Thermoproteota archaeon]